MKITIKTNGHALKCSCSAVCKQSPRHLFAVVKKRAILVLKQRSAKKA